MKDKFVFIESNTSGTGELFLQEVLKRDMEVLFLTQFPHKYTYLQANLVHPLYINTSDEEEVFNFLAQQERIEAIFSSSELYIEMTSRLAKRLGLRGNNPHAIAICRDKYTLYQKLSECGIKVAKTKQISAKDDLESILSVFSYPVIIKPSQLSGSVGVKLCYNFGEAVEYVADLFEKNGSPYFLNVTSNLVVQEFIEGEEYSVETITNKTGHKIIGITKKYLGALPYFVEVGHDFPGMNEKNPSYFPVISAVQEALNAVNFTFGPAHTEVRIKDDQVYIIEINPRLAGGMIPKLIQLSTKEDVIKEVIDFYLGSNRQKDYLASSYASLRFLIPPYQGYLQEVCRTPGVLDQQDDCSVHLVKTPGSILNVEHDFRDRIGYIIIQDSSPQEAAKKAAKILKSITIKVVGKTEETNIQDTGILKSTLHPLAYEIISKPNRESHKKIKDDLEMLVLINQAHLIMLTEQGLYAKDDCAKILFEMNELKKEGFTQLILQKAERGTYFLLEKYLIEELGIDVVGSIHMGRSRNDILEAIFRLSSRTQILELFQSLWKLRSSLLSKCEKSLDLPFPIYSQFQLAFPSNLSHYLLGIEASFARSQSALVNTFSEINLSPLGNCAGGGTTVKIDPEITASLLGFGGVVQNSLDGISNKDSALRLLSDLAIISTTISRVASDFQLWSTREFDFLTLPDSLLGSSSMMPQKRNPYLLEEIKVKTTSVIANMFGLFSSIQKTPSGNSYEAKKVINLFVYDSFEALNDSLTLMQLHLDNVEFKSKRIEEALRSGLALAPIASELIASKGHTSKEAHIKVGSFIRSALESHGNPFKSLMSNLSAEGIQISENPLDWAYANEFGGGPGKISTIRQLKEALVNLKDDAAWFHSMDNFIKTAQGMKEDKVLKIIGEGAKNPYTNRTRLSGGRKV